jgi:hypothetical protein
MDSSARPMASSSACITRDTNEVAQRILPDGTILGCRHDHDQMASMHGVEIAGAQQTEIDAFASMNNGATPDGSASAFAEALPFA